MNATTGAQSFTRDEGCFEQNKEQDDYQPAPNPVNPNVIAYGHCNNFNFDNNGNPVSVKETLYTTNYGVNSGGHTEIGCDEGAMEQPSWSPDGSRIVDVEMAGSTDKGIWTYPAAGGACASGSQGETYVVNAGPDRLGSPRYMGANKILFHATSPSGQTTIKSVPATCSTPLFDGACSSTATAQSLVADGAFPTWTAATTDFRFIPDPPPANNQDGGGSGGGGGGTTPGNTTPGGTTPSGPTTPTGPGSGPSFDLATVLQSAALSGKPTRKKGVTLLVNLAAPATVEFAFKKLGTVRKNGKAGKNSFRFTKVGKKKLKKGRYTVTIRVIGPGGKKGPAKTVRFTVKK
jgi:hypothetical protein